VKILAAEDKPDIAAQYEIALKARVHGVIIKTDSQAYVVAYHATLRQTRNAANLFDAVIVDYRMPEKDGLEVAKEILP
jgi:DNA-binding response OmpR family regulator